MSPAAHSSLPRRAFQWDLARQVERLDVLLGLLPRYAEWGYQELYLHLEDAVDYPSVPGVARADAYTYAELQELVQAARRVNIGVVPIVNLLGHTQYLIKTPAWRDLNELRDGAGAPLDRGQICPLHPQTREVAQRLLHDMRPFCTAGKVHVGLDESFHLGKCPRCRAEIEQQGLAFHFASYVGRLHRLTESQGLRLGMWADMLYFIPEAIPQLPKGIIAYDWYYYPFKRHPRVELFNFAERDLSKALQSQAIEYWGCPMNGAFRYEPLPIFRDRLANIRSWWDRCRKRNAGGLLVTSWEAYRLALEATTLVDAAASTLWQEEWTERSDSAMLTRGFQRLSGARRVAAHRSAQTALASDVYPYAGYARWEINDRWEVAAGLPPDSTETAHFEGLLQRHGVLPDFLRHSLEFRLYLARRDLFVRSAAEAVFALRRDTAEGISLRHSVRAVKLLRSLALFADHLESGIRAAEAMWALSRSVAHESQNLQILHRDAARLTALTDWLHAVLQEPAQVWTASPVCGAWQFRMDVTNFAPALQRVVLERQEPDGQWHEVHGRYTIEFQARAAKPRTQLVRPFSAALPNADAPLRLALHGLGEVQVKNLSVTDGVTTRRLRTAENRRVLGRPAPTAGFPDVRAVQDILPLEWV